MKNLNFRYVGYFSCHKVYEELYLVSLLLSISCLSHEDEHSQLLKHCVLLKIVGLLKSPCAWDFSYMKLVSRT